MARNIGTLYPALLKLEQEGAIAAEWRPSEKSHSQVLRDNADRPAAFARETRDWLRTADVIAAFLAPKREAW